MVSTIDPIETELIADMARFTHDPLKWVLYTFPWGSGELSNFSGPEKWQRDLLGKIRDRLMTPDQAIRAAIASGHGIGKSALVSWVILWAMSTRENTRGIVTANTDTQLRTKTWSELAKWYRLCICRHWFVLTATAIHSANPDYAKTWRIDAIPWSENNTEAFAGLHNQGNRILLVFDEASAIDDRIWEVAEGALTDADTEILWLAFGNPTRNAGRFRECWGRFRERWITDRVDSRSVSFSNKTEIAQWQKDYGEDSDFFRVRVKGEFPNASSMQLIPLALVEAAMARTAKPHDFDYAPVILGVDVARYGDDKSVIVKRQGMAASILKILSGIDTMTLCGLICQESDAHQADAIFIDGGGLGGGPIDRLRELGRSPIEVNFGSLPTQTRFDRKNIEMWWLMKEWLEQGGILPADCQDLKDELISREYGMTSAGKLTLERKEDLKKRGLASPDRADALALTFAFPVMKRDGGANSPIFCRHEYNPIA